MTTLRFVDDRTTSNEEEEEVVSKILYEEEAGGSTDPLLVRKRGLANKLRNQEGYLSTQVACLVIMMKERNGKREGHLRGVQKNLSRGVGKTQGEGNYGETRLFVTYPLQKTMHHGGEGGKDLALSSRRRSVRHWI